MVYYTPYLANSASICGNQLFSIGVQVKSCPLSLIFLINAKLHIREYLEIFCLFISKLKFFQSSQIKIISRFQDVTKSFTSCCSIFQSVKSLALIQRT